MPRMKSGGSKRTQHSTARSQPTSSRNGRASTQGTTTSKGVVKTSVSGGPSSDATQLSEVLPEDTTAPIGAMVTKHDENEEITGEREAVEE